MFSLLTMRGGQVFRTAALEVRVERDPLRLVVSDLAGHVLCADAIGRPTEFAHGGFTVSKEMPGDEHFYGLGDKSGSFDRREQAFTLWNTDVGPQESTDPLYKSIPFFLGLDERRDEATGCFSITRGARGLTSARPRVMRIRLARKADRSITTSSTAQRQSRWCSLMRI